MIELILGFALGAMALTDTGHEIGNKIAEFVQTQISKIGEEADANDK